MRLYLLLVELDDI